MDSIVYTVCRARSIRSNRNGRLGFSYLELTAALFVFSLGIMGAFQLFHFTLSKTRVIKEDAIAMRAIQNEIETLRVQPFSELVDGTRGLTSACPELAQLKNAHGDVRIDPYEGFPGDLKQVQVTLEWTGDNARHRTLSSTTLLGNRGGSS